MLLLGSSPGFCLPRRRRDASAGPAPAVPSSSFSLHAWLSAGGAKGISPARHHWESRSRLTSGLGRSSSALACEGHHLFAALSSECQERRLRRLIPGSFVTRGEED